MNVPFIQCLRLLIDSVTFFFIQYFANEIFIQMFHYFNFLTLFVKTFYLISSPEAHRVARPIFFVAIDKGGRKATIEVRAKKLMFHGDSVGSALQGMTRTCESLRKGWLTTGVECKRLFAPRRSIFRPVA